MIIFIIISASPGDPFSELAQNPDIPVEVRDNLRKQLGIDDPIHIQYIRWLTSMLRGDWGFSIANRVNVLDLVWQRLPTTLFVMGSAQIIALLIAIPIGVLSAVKQYSWLDQIATTISFLGFSLPTFFTGLVFILVFAIELGWFPMIYSSNIEASGIEWVVQTIRNAFMPIMVLALAEGAQLTRYVRSSMLDVVRLDYVRTARAKGLSERAVTIRHALRNALIPVVTILALNLPNVFTGAVVTEQIFRVPGIGSLLITSLTRKDLPVIMAIVFTASMLVVLFTLIADVLYSVLDPRIKYS